MTAIRIGSYFFAVILLASYPLRAKLLAKHSGVCLLPLTQSPNRLYLFAAAAAFIMLAVLYFRNFTLLITLILHVTPLLAIELAVRDRLYKHTAGIYENLMIVDSRKIFINDIVSFTPLVQNNEGENTEANADKQENRVLKLFTEKSGEIFVGFENREERDKAVQILKQRLAEKEAAC